MRPMSEIKEICKEKGLDIVEESFDGLFARFRSGRKKTVIASWGGGWEHVSINDWVQTPTWEEMCELKEIFFKDEETVVQYHPAKSDYVNNLQHCLHLWRPIEKYTGTMPIPDTLLVGIKGLEIKKEN